MRYLILIVLSLSGCSMLIEKSAFKSDDQLKLDQDFAYCDHEAKEYARKFNLYNPTLSECMRLRGHSLKR